MGNRRKHLLSLTASQMRSRKRKLELKGGKPDSVLIRIGSGHSKAGLNVLIGSREPMDVTA